MCLFVISISSLMKYFYSLFELDVILLLTFCFENSLCVLDANSLIHILQIIFIVYYFIFIFVNKCYTYQLCYLIWYTMFTLFPFHSFSFPVFFSSSNFSWFQAAFLTTCHARFYIFLCGGWIRHPKSNEGVYEGWDRLNLIISYIYNICVDYSEKM